MKRDETTLTVERPRTEAGRALLAAHEPVGLTRDGEPVTRTTNASMLRAILAIEQEATALASRDIDAGVKAWRGSWADPGIPTPNPDGTASWRPTPLTENEAPS